MMTPREIVQILNQHIIGQDKAKRAVAIALRDRWRRMQLSEDLQHEIVPKNILMMGPTGVGKTEIARRLARLSHAPFIKVEATKFTEVGYVGRNVESMIRDLVNIAIKQAREKETERVRFRAEESAEEQLLDVLCASGKHGSERQALRVALRENKLNDKEVEIDVSPSAPNVEIVTPPGMEGLTTQLQGMFEKISGGKKQKRRLMVSQAFKLLVQEHARSLIDEDTIKMKAIENVEQNAIVFIDEIDKVAKHEDSAVGSGVSREGVQRDLLPLVEGCTVSTQYGAVKTDHILFIASGAFHVSKPSDLIPELQGRFPIRVELQPLTTEEFFRILKETEVSLIDQYTKMIGAEGICLEFDDAAIRRIAEIAYQVNTRDENIGARRLYTAMECLLEEVSFSAPDLPAKEPILVDTAYVDKHLAKLADNKDLSQYIL